ncbi:MAG: DUF3473 domain-containing protein, partial [candidate division Zixibacteria bacterium]|nr:DUF3473 domain-containing protein [candidate division Zixibacteria bacterium]
DPMGPQAIFRMNLSGDRHLYEIPASTINILGKKLPVCGGGYLRHSPLWYTSWVIRRLNKINRPAVVYVHPWELDKMMPRVKGLTYFQKYRQYGTIPTLFKKLDRLLNEFEFCPAKRYIEWINKRPIGFDR